MIDLTIVSLAQCILSSSHHRVIGAVYTVIGAVYTVIISPSCCGRSPLSSSLSLHRLFFSSLSLPASTMVFTRSPQLVLKAPLTAILTHDFNLLYHMCQKLVPAAVYQLCLFNLTAPVCTQPHCRCGGYDRILERRHCCVKPGPRTVNQLLGTVDILSLYTMPNILCWLITTAQLKQHSSPMQRKSAAAAGNDTH